MDEKKEVEKETSPSLCNLGFLRDKVEVKLEKKEDTKVENQIGFWLEFGLTISKGLLIFDNNAQASTMAPYWWNEESARQSVKLDHENGPHERENSCALAWAIIKWGLLKSGFSAADCPPHFCPTQMQSRWASFGAKTQSELRPLFETFCNFKIQRETTTLLHHLSLLLLCFGPHFAPFSRATFTCILLTVAGRRLSPAD